MELSSSKTTELCEGPFSDGGCRSTPSHMYRIPPKGELKIMAMPHLCTPGVTSANGGSPRSQQRRLPEIPTKEAPRDHSQKPEISTALSEKEENEVLRAQVMLLLYSPQKTDPLMSTSPISCAIIVTWRSTCQQPLMLVLPRTATL